jgi:hypothetical protein
MVTDPPYGVEYDPEWRQIGWTGPRATGRVEMMGEQIGARLRRYSPATWRMFGTLLCICTKWQKALPRSVWSSERGSERLMQAHNQHSETRRPSDRDRIGTTGPSRFQPARPEVLG